ncbi:MAG: DUF6629 family protein [Cyanobacteria bacterium P01_A01_bin.15]
MCFSAAASFTASALLIPTGLYGCSLAISRDRCYLPLAVIPCMFGIQQGFEGMIWWATNHGQMGLANGAALGFLGFSHCFWLLWLPLAMLFLEQRPWVRRVLMGFLGVGVLFGLSLYGPFLLLSDTFAVMVNQGSIDYQTRLLYDQFWPRAVSRLVYMLIVLGPLWLSQRVQLRVAGGFIALALLVTYWFYNYAFASVWCFFAAVLSGYIVYFVGFATTECGLEKDSQ